MGQAESVDECCKAGRAESGPLEKQSRMSMNQDGLRMASSHINIPDACSTSMEGGDAAKRERQTKPAELTWAMLGKDDKSDDDESDSDAASSHDEILHQQSLRVDTTWTTLHDVPRHASEPASGDTSGVMRAQSRTDPNGVVLLMPPPRPSVQSHAEWKQLFGLSMPAAHPDQEDNAEIDSSPSGRRSATHTATQSELLKGKHADEQRELRSDLKKLKKTINRLESKLEKHRKIDADAYHHQQRLLLSTNKHVMRTTAEQLIWKKKEFNSKLGELKRVQEIHSHEVGAMYLEREREC